MATFNHEIPSKIHVIWMGLNVPRPVTELINDCERLNPGFEIHLWRDADIDSLNLGRNFDNEPKMSARANIARYVILRDHGGIYLDADFRVFRSLKAILDLGSQTGFVACRESKTRFNNAFFASAPQHPLIALLAEGIDLSYEVLSGSGSVTKTGPGYLTSTLLRYISTGASITELPQHYVYPYFYDRPDLAVRAVSPETFLRHEWATIGDKWGQNNDFRSFLNPVSFRTRSLISLARSLKISSMRASLSVRPEAHIFRDGFHNIKSSLLSFEATRVSRKTKTDLGNTSQRSAQSGRYTIPSPVRSSMIREVRKRVKGSATFVDVGLPTSEFWHQAAGRIDRPGRSIRVGTSLSDPTFAGETQTNRISRGSMALLISNEIDLATGNVILSSGVPLRPRTLDRTRTLDKWDVHAETWHLASFLETCPHIELLMVNADASLEGLHKVLKEMTIGGRIGAIAFLIDPNSTTQPLIEYGKLFRDLEKEARSIRCLGTLPKEGLNSWEFQMRAAQLTFGLLFNFSDRKPDFRDNE